MGTVATLCACHPQFLDLGQTSWPPVVLDKPIATPCVAYATGRIATGYGNVRFATASVTGLLLLAACAVQQPSPTPSATDSAHQTETGVATEAARLRSLLAQAVPQSATCHAVDAIGWIEPAQTELARAGVTIDRPQVLVVVDRNPRRQELCLVLAQPHATWKVLGGSKVSTGQAGRHGYFITPTGVFLHRAGIVDFRAEGTFNEDHIRGLGRKGMRVWDLGWQQAEKGWTSDGDTGEIRLLLHATDPDVLEPRLGRPSSKGCVRLPAAMNVFLDHHGVLDADYEVAARTNPRIAALLPPDKQPTPLAGDAVVIIDSSRANK